MSIPLFSVTQCVSQLHIINTKNQRQETYSRKMVTQYILLETRVVNGGTSWQEYMHKQNIHILNQSREKMDKVPQSLQETEGSSVIPCLLNVFPSQNSLILRTNALTHRLLGYSTIKLQHLGEVIQHPIYIVLSVLHISEYPKCCLLCMAFLAQNIFKVYPSYYIH